MKTQALVIGTGFQGICDAANLLNSADVDVHILDAAPVFGGILRSFEINGFHVDKGLHLFSGVDRHMHAFLDDILEGNLHHISKPPATIFGGARTENFDLPDLSVLPELTRRKILFEIGNLSADDAVASANLAERLDRRYGDTAGDIFKKIFFKIHGHEAQYISPLEILKTSLGRLKFGSDGEMLNLKKDPNLDKILAARRPIETAARDISSYYPSGDGMIAFADAAQSWLTARGVKVHLKAEITALVQKQGRWLVDVKGSSYEFDHIIWSNGSLYELSNLLNFTEKEPNPFLPVSVIFCVFGADADDVQVDTYTQIFDTDSVVSRVGAGGIFSEQTREDGSTFITCECPTPISSPFWETAEHRADDIWNCLEKNNLVKSDAQYNWYKVIRAPQTLKLQKAGSEVRTSELAEKISTLYPGIFFREHPPAFRRDIFSASKHLLDDIGI